ncbi:MAG: S41 family peptidase [Candidatus Coatesbacteria bacterium]|nr:S41 family peptidase [Candidatus Coatesbacteria bacterium]
MRQTFRWVLTVVLVALFAIVGIGIGSNLTTHFRNLFVYNEVLTIVQHRYVEKQDPSDLIMSSIQGMLRTLDPHSHLLNELLSKQMREDQKGSFYGIGIQFDIINGILTVISPIEDTPASKVGLLAGDRIVEIDGEDARGITTVDVIRKLKGPKGTKVVITVQREGVSEHMTFTLKRDKIPTTSVPYYFMLNDTIGYLRLTRFAETTASEMNTAIHDLKNDGMQELVLDLRYNGGGLLTQAIAVSDMFLESGLQIVSTKGRTAESNQAVFASKRTKLPRVPLIILIDDGTASGSEIVSGAVQDNDRGLVIGTTSFGKGLVQSVIQLPENWTLVLTTARYYTPSGRCIQKPYSEYGSSVYLGNETDGNEKAPPVYHSRAGRELTGGGGIHPDVVVEGTTLNKDFETLIRKNIFTLFGLHYAAQHRDLEKDFEITDEVVSEFIAFAANNDVVVNKDELMGDHPEFVKTYIRWRIVRSLWGNKEAAIAFSAVDEPIQKAIELMPEARKMLDDVYIPLLKELQDQNSQPIEGSASNQGSFDMAA